ncbi:MAG: hypothetical protein ACYTGN_00580 [Planctomycetota bacterium]|jgi:hypothetical protein
MKAHAALLLNLAILVVNFVLAFGATETQVKVLRTTARAAFSPPVRATPDPIRSPARPDTARLLKYLGKLDSAVRLTGEQGAALCASLEACRTLLDREAYRLKQRRLDAAALAGLKGRMRDATDVRLRAAGIHDPQLRSELVRIVLSATG